MGRGPERPGLEQVCALRPQCQAGAMCGGSARGEAGLQHLEASGGQDHRVTPCPASPGRPSGATSSGRGVGACGGQGVLPTGGWGPGAGAERDPPAEPTQGQARPRGPGRARVCMRLCLSAQPQHGLQCPPSRPWQECGRASGPASRMVLPGPRAPTSHRAACPQRPTVAWPWGSDCCWL